MPFPAPTLVVDRLACIRSGRPVFAGLSFDCSAGDIVLLSGANGAGKSSLLRILSGLLRPAAGAISWRRGDPDGERVETPALAYCGHRDPVKAWLTVQEHLAFWSNWSDASDIAVAAEAFGIAHLMGRNGNLLSAGQRRRLALARLAVSDAPVWLLDEPTASLDEDGVRLVEQALEHHRASGGLSIVATHLPISVTDAQILALGSAAGPAADDPAAPDLRAAPGAP